MEVAASLGAFGATTPMHALPWYFGVSVFVVWAAAAVALGLLVRRRMRARVDRRQAVRHARADRRVRDDRSLGSGADIEQRGP